MSRARRPPLRQLLPAEIEDIDGGGLTQVATDPWRASWPSDRALRRPGGGLPRPLAEPFGAASRAIRRVGERAAASWIAAPLAIALVSRLYSTLLLAIVPIFQPSLSMPRLTGLGEPFLQWDSQWYLTIANWGYHADPIQAGPFGGRHDFAFFPAWPTLIRAAESLGLQASAIAAPLADGLFIVAAVFIYVVLQREFGRTTALWGVTLLAFAPPAFVLSMAYSEPLFLLLLGALWASRSGRVRAVLGLALGVTRLSALAVGAASGLRWLRDWRDWRAFATAAAIGLGFAAWWVFIWQLTGDPAGWLQGSAHWMPKLGLVAIQAAIQEATTPRLGALLFVALMLGASLLLARRNLELGAYSVIAIGLSILGAPVESMPRHALVAFPAFGLIANRLGPRWSAVLVIVFAALQANDVMLSFLGSQPFAP